MEPIRQVAMTRPYHSRVFEEYFGGLSTAIFDIETTGLYPGSSRTILGGLLLPGEDGSQILQYFAEDNRSEKELLLSYSSALSSCDVLISYNGNGFDLPFLKHRFEKYKIPLDLDISQSFDLYRALHHYSKMREILPNLKQKTIEAYLGLSPEREDEISGGESVVLYEEYLRTGSPGVREKILLHNRDDLIQLSAILRILDKLDLHKILFHEGFAVASGEKRVFLKKMTMGRNLLTVTGRTRDVDLDYYSFETGYQAVHRIENKELTLSIPFETRQGAAFLDLESITADFSPLEIYPSFASGYLILQEKKKTNYAEINKMVKIILGEILTGL